MGATARWSAESEARKRRGESPFVESMRPEPPERVARGVGTVLRDSVPDGAAERRDLSISEIRPQGVDLRRRREGG